jgi:hypothetical protein
MGNLNTNQWWKIAVCILGVFMIAGAVIYTVMTRNAVSSNAQAGNGATTQPAASNKPTSGGVGELNWVKNLNTRYETNDYIFIILPGNEDSTDKVTQAVNSSVEKIRKESITIDAMTLSSKDPEFAQTTERLAIQKLPAVLLFAASGQGAILKGDITETKLLQAFITLQNTCVPGTSGCCPTK